MSHVPGANQSVNTSTIPLVYENKALSMQSTPINTSQNLVASEAMQEGQYNINIKKEKVAFADYEIDHIRNEESMNTGIIGNNSAPKSPFGGNLVDHMFEVYEDNAVQNVPQSSEMTVMPAMPTMDNPEIIAETQNTISTLSQKQGNVPPDYDLIGVAGFQVEEPQPKKPQKTNEVAQDVISAEMNFKENYSNLMANFDRWNHDNNAALLNELICTMRNILSGDADVQTSYEMGVPILWEIENHKEKTIVVVKKKKSIVIENEKIVPPPDHQDENSSLSASVISVKEEIPEVLDPMDAQEKENVGNCKPCSVMLHRVPQDIISVFEERKLRNRPKDAKKLPEAASADFEEMAQGQDNNVSIGAEAQATSGFSCSVCSRSFQNRRNLNSHRCPICLMCKKLFPTMNDYYVHIRKGCSVATANDKALNTEVRIKQEIIDTDYQQTEPTVKVEPETQSRRRKRRVRFANKPIKQEFQENVPTSATTDMIKVIKEEPVDDYVDNGIDIDSPDNYESTFDEPPTIPELSNPMSKINKLIAKAQSARKASMEKGAKSKLCSFCFKRCGSSVVMNFHEKKHVHEKPFKCNECNQEFDSKFACFEHEIIHDKGIFNGCFFCRSTFTTYKERYMHIKTIHIPKVKK